ncbi:MAG: peptidylprolyl isomerase [Gammaproteobacteria bacterium]|nr:peptidylprolyl isomerase [Gammaproteobacteria bacterium]
MHHRYSTWLIGLATYALLVGPGSASAQTRELSESGQLLDGIAALVNDGVVLKSELETETSRIVERLRAEGQQVPPPAQLVPQVLERLVIQRIQLQRAERVGIQISDETLNQALANIAERNGVSLTELPTVLAQEGIDYGTYRTELRNQLAVEQLRQRDVIARISVSPRELDEYLERQQGREFASQEFNISQILIATSAIASPDDVARAERRIDELYRRATSGEIFSQLAIANSDGQRALEGGELGWRRGDELPTIFADVVPGLQPGQVSEPIRSSSGFHLVRLNDRRGGEPIMENQVRVRHILLTTNEVLDDEAVRQKLLEVRSQIIGGDDFAAVATAMSEDPGSAVEGGDMGWTNPNVFVPEFREVCNTLPIGVLSDPVQTPFGWHLIEVLDRRIEDTTEEVARQQAIMAIRNSKLGEESELWARRLRDQAFVEYRL